MESELAGNHGTVPDAGDSEQSRYRPRHRTVSSTTMMSESLMPGPNQPSMRTRPAGARATGGAQTGGGETVAFGGVWARAAAGTDDETAAASIEILGKVLNRCMWKPRPNGSRLSCGRNARRRKAVEPQTRSVVGEATQLFPTGERPAASSA